MIFVGYEALLITIWTDESPLLNMQNYEEISAWKNTLNIHLRAEQKQG